VRSRDPVRTRRAAVLLVLAICLGLGVSGLPVAGAASYPTIPLGLDRWFVSNLTGAELAPGGGGSISFTIGNPLTGVAISSTLLTLQVYAFNAFPGNATSTVEVSAPPVLVPNSTLYLINPGLSLTVNP